MKPSEIFDTNQDSTFWDYFESAWLYPPWIFGSKTLMMDSIFFFVVNCVPFFIICYSQIHIQKFSNQKHVNFWCALVIRIFQQFLSQVMAIPQTFRLSYLIEQIFILRTDIELKMIFSFVIAFINIILHVIHTYLSSLFLVPMDFVSHSKADYYDGKYMTTLHVIRIIIAINCFELSYIKNPVVAAIIIGGIFFICILTLCFRMTIQSHASSIGQFFELLPFFDCPFMILFHYFVQNNIYSLMLFIVLFIVFAIMFRIHTHYMVKLSLKAFSPFMRQSKQNSSSSSSSGDFNINDEANNISNDDFTSSFMVGSVISVIRIVAAEYSDPDCLMRFMVFQKRSSELKNSYIIEVVRFLALFPSKRKECLRELKNFHSHSNFNSFTVFVFKKILKSLEGIESTKKNLVCLNNFYRSFLVHKHLFWVARKEKKCMIASKEALSTAYFYIEVKNEFHYLMKRYAFDSFLHYYYADFCLSACGDFECYLNECQIARMLDKHFNTSKSGNINTSSSSSTLDFNKEKQSKFVKDNIVDPLLHPMSIINPKILQFCSSEETKSNIYSTNQKKLEFMHRNSIVNNKEKKRKYEKSRPVATFLNEKKHLIPFFAILHIYVPIALFLYVIGELYIKDRQINDQSKELYKTSIDLLNTFYTASSSVYLPYLTHEFLNYSDDYNLPVSLLNILNYTIKNYKTRLKNQVSNNTTNSSSYNLTSNGLRKGHEKFFSSADKVMEDFINLPFKVIDFYSRVQPLGNLTGGMIYIFERHISHLMFRKNTIKDALSKISFDLDFIVRGIFSDVYNKVSDIKKYAIILREIYKDDLNGFYIFKVSVVTICTFAVISSVVYIFQINCIYRNDKIKIEFLSSEQVFSMFLLQESKKAWELLRQYVDSSSEATTTEIGVVSARSSINLSAIIDSNDYINSKPNLTDTDNINEPLLDMTVNGHDFNKDLRSLLNSNKSIQTNDSNLKLKFHFKDQRHDDDDEFESRYYTFYDENKDLDQEGSDTESLSTSDDDLENKKSKNESRNANFHEENEICSQAIEISKATEKEGFLSCPYFHLVILLFTPLVFTILVIAMFQAPLILRAHQQEETYQNILDGESMANHSLILLNATYYILEKRSGIYREKATDCSIGKRFFWIEKERISLNNFYNSSDDVINTSIDEILSDLKNLSIFKDEICYELYDIVCMSVETAFKMTLDPSTTPSTIASRCIPFIYLFSWNLFQDLFFSGVKDLLLMKISNGRSFIVATVLLMLTFVDLSFSSAILLKKAFNSLFHFPDDFLKHPTKKPKDNSKSDKGKMPQNALVVTSLTQSGEIYSVSDNSKEIINRNLNDLISLKMCEVFPKVAENSQLCEFSITDKKKKIFRFSTEEIGCLTKTVLVEENSPIFDNTREQSCVYRLNGFIPPHFAELYGKNDQYEFNYFNNYIIAVRISSDISTPMIEKCFNAANHISQNSVSIDIINVDGEMITFSSISNCKLIVILLLIRDFIDDVLKSTKIDNCIYSIYVHYLKEFVINVVHNDELYLEFQPHDQNFFRFRLYQIENGKIALSENVESCCSFIAEITEKETISTDLDENKDTVLSIPISQISSKIAVFV